jgi:hypothetical protein
VVVLDGSIYSFVLMQLEYIYDHLLLFREIMYYFNHVKALVHKIWASNASKNPSRELAPRREINTQEADFERLVP